MTAFIIGFVFFLTVWVVAGLFFLWFLGRIGMWPPTEEESNEYWIEELLEEED